MYLFLLWTLYLLTFLEALLRFLHEVITTKIITGKAMNTIIACMEDFVKDQKYYNYRYLEKDKRKPYKDERNQRRIVFSSHIKLTR